MPRAAARVDRAESGHGGAEGRGTGEGRVDLAMGGGGSRGCHAVPSGTQKTNRRSGRAAAVGVGWVG